MSNATSAESSADTYDELTQDGLFERSVYFAQPKVGYRAAIDGLLLVHFAGATEGLAVDLGAGAGQITLAMLARKFAASLVAVEPYSAAAALMLHNLQKNHWESQVRILNTTARLAAQSFRGSAKLVLANPPFYHTGAATPPQDTHKEWSRTGEEPLEEFLSSARNLLGRGGRACFVWPARDLTELMVIARSKGLGPRRMVHVHHHPGHPASRVLVELRPGKGGNLEVEPPYFLEAPAENGQLAPTELLVLVTGKRAVRS